MTTNKIQQLQQYRVLQVSQMWSLSLSPPHPENIFPDSVHSFDTLHKGMVTSWAGRSMGSVRFHHATRDDVNLKLVSYTFLQVSASYFRP